MSKRLVFEATFDYADLCFMLRRDFPDKTEEQMKSAIRYVETTLHPHLLDRLYETLRHTY